MRRFLHDNGLSLFFGAIFLLALAGQAVAGDAEYNNQQMAQGLQTVSLLEYVTTSDFAVDVTENWQSEYLQFFLFIVATVWLVQRGSPESKEIDEVGTESDEKQMVGEHAIPESPRSAQVGGLRELVFSRSLGLMMGVLFLLSWLAQSVAGWAAYNQEQLSQQLATLPWTSYLTSADFWSRSLQNWQSEFLAVGSMAVLSVFLRQRGSEQSKPVGSPHHQTGVEG